MSTENTTEQTETLEVGAGEQVESQDTGEESEGGEESVESEGGEGDTWQPNYKVRSRDTEVEIDDWMKPLIKDKESEKRVRDLYERVLGFDHLRGDRDVLREHNSQLMEYAQEAETIKSELSEIGGLLRSNDPLAVETAFEKLNIPDDIIFQYALHKLKLRDADPQTQAAYNEYKQQQLALQEMQRENSYYQNQLSEFQVQQRANELELVLSNPEVTGVAQAFDARRGAGAFRNEVINQGRYHFHTTGQDLPVHEAVRRVVDLIGYQPNTQQNVGSGGFNRAAGVKVQSNQNSKPVLPGMRGSGASAVKKVPRSINDLRQMAATMET